jgi:tRNA (guanine37-N1)-methyltransferase
MAPVRVDVVTLFPDLIASGCDHSIVGRARRRGIVDLAIHDPRSFAGGRHRVVDDRPFGGGPGMVLMAPPIAACLDRVLARDPRPRLLITDPQGRRLDQGFVRELAAEPHLAILCGHYEGIDRRIQDLYRPEGVSIGDYVLSGGEPAALVVIDAIVRLLPGALNDPESAVQDSFAADGSLDHPCYTRPRSFRGIEVPEALVAGDHRGIAAWRRNTRPDPNGR